MKTAKKQSKGGIVRDVGGKNVLFVDDKAVGELRAGLAAELSYAPGDTAGDTAKGVLAVAYLLESMSDAGNNPIDAIVACGLSRALEHYAENVRRYSKAKAVTSCSA